MFPDDDDRDIYADYTDDELARIAEDEHAATEELWRMVHSRSE